MRLHLFFAFLAGLVVTMAATAADDPKNPTKKSFLDGKEAGPDFAVQGEYAGKLGDAGIGVQVIARGDGKFDAVVLPGGLPGAGWDGKGRHPLSGKTQDDKTNLKGEGGTAVINGETLALTWGDKKADLKKQNRQSPTMGQQPPKGAITLFDGGNVDAWTPGKLEDGELMGVGTRTKQKFDSFTLHLEFRSPFMPYATGQARGNSGMYLQDQYECQILDSFGLTGEDNECGGIYKNSRPSVNMCLPPLTWQTYDVEFTGAKFDADGKVTAPAKCTMKHNGVLIHDDLELKLTPGGGQANQQPGALFLQDHGDAVRFRNIWILEKK
jgi:hypothetical protein